MRTVAIGGKEGGKDGGRDGVGCSWAKGGRVEEVEGAFVGRGRERAVVCARDVADRIKM